MANCSCGSGLDYSQCCEPYIKGNVQPETCEALLRARYTAYTMGELDYIYETIHPEQKEQHDSKATKKWADESTWLSFEIIGIKKGQKEDDEGFIEFKVRYRQKLQNITHHEMAYFKKNEGMWYFFDGEPVSPETYVREDKKIGRNEPCPCGSGKKYKKCCMA
ncbi:MAG: YchJ family protein [Desulfobacteraceae bacterium]|nr:YchJ family protein [Desulfobacteraceae bacterium]MCB9495158.1 YchJ family protein [Desulfobacteraceae bacterium]